MSKHISFLREAIKDWRSTGSIVRSSPDLIRKMLQPIRFEEVDLIVELGAGQGCITKALADALLGNTHLLAFELNDHFLKELSLLQKENVEIINGDALNLSTYVKRIRRCSYFKFTPCQLSIYLKKGYFNTVLRFP